MVFMFCRWLILQVVDHFLASIMITFDALQLSNATMSQQMTNIERLADELVHRCGVTVDEFITNPSDVAEVVPPGNAIKMGPYSVTPEKLKDFITCMGVAALEDFENLASNAERNSVLRSVSVLYLVALNGIMEMKAERNCYGQEFDEVPPHTPLALIETSTVEFVHLVRKHKPRIKHSFDDNFLKRITDEHLLLQEAVAKEPRFKASLLKVGNSASFNNVWATAGQRFASLRQFAAGLATVMPTTSRVEADFSFINYRKDEFNSALSDFSLEGVLFARQRKDLDSLLACLHE